MELDDKNNCDYPKSEENKADALSEHDLSKDQSENHNVKEGSTDNEPFNGIVVDHVILDLTIVDEKTGEVFDQPWLTVAIDYYSRTVLATHISLGNPIKDSEMIEDIMNKLANIPDV